LLRSSGLISNGRSTAPEDPIVVRFGR